MDKINNIPQSLGTYVYLASLAEDFPSFATEAAAYSTFNIEGKQNNAAGEEITPIIHAIKALENISNMERKKELLAIESYIKKIDKIINDKNDSNVPDELIKKLRVQKEKLNSLDFTDYDKHQADFINAINIVQTSLNKYKNRLTQITNRNDVKNVKKRTIFNMQKRVENFLLQDKNIREDRPKEEKERDKYMSKLINELVKDVIPDFPSDLQEELRALIFIDFNDWVENEAEENKKGSYLKLNNDDLNELFTKVYKGQIGRRGVQTHFQRMLASQKELISLATDMKKQLKGVFLSEEEYERIKKDYEELSLKQQKDKTIPVQDQQYTLSQIQNLIDTYNANLFKKDNHNLRYSFTLHTKTSHGNFSEFLQQILMSSVNIKGNVAVDTIIPYGTITYSFDGNDQKQQQELVQLSKQIDSYLTKQFNEKEVYDIKDFNKQIEHQRQLSRSIQNAVSSAEETLSSLAGTGEQFFIAHDTMKLYASIEEGKANEFHGREMNAMTALSKLYAANPLMQNMIDPNNLILYLINISDATLAKNKSPLETYLSLFAGLLMFDDIKTIAEIGVKQITEESPTPTINQLHLYDVEGIYVPLSVILDNLTSQLKNITSTLTINKKNTAVAKISQKTPSAGKYSTSNDWDSLASSTLASTKIQIIFLAGFTDFINSIWSSFSGK